MIKILSYGASDVPHSDFKVIIDLFYHCKRDASHYVCYHLANNYLGFVSIARGISRRLVLWAFASLVALPFAFESLVSLIGRANWKLGAGDRKIGAHIAEIKSRYT